MNNEHKPNIRICSDDGNIKVAEMIEILKQFPMDMNVMIQDTSIPLILHQIAYVQQKTFVPSNGDAIEVVSISISN